ncbi:MAG: iduronate-2-sulfatase [Planctomyces sp.]|nr:iduronate-2-sulfatase [Planctomyces sp.]
MRACAIALLLWIQFASSALAAQPNLLILCIDDLRPDLGCYGVKSVPTPHIDELASRGRVFTRHYVQAPTCGASRCAFLTGRYGPAGNNALFELAKRRRQDQEAVPPSMPEYFRAQGYTTVSVGKISHHPGGRGGADWNDDDSLEMPGAWSRHLMPTGPWKHPRGAMHGLANGEIRSGAKGSMPVFQSAPKADDIFPDDLIAEEALAQLEQLTRQETPFLLAVGLIRPHLPFGAPQAYLRQNQDRPLDPIPHPAKPAWPSTWHSSNELRQYQLWGRDPVQDAAFADEIRRHYQACVSYADANVGRILAKLSASPAARNTVVVLWGDHGCHLGEHAVWGKHTLFEESLRSPLIIATEGLAHPGKSTNAVVESIDVFPTLCELTGLEVPTFVQGTTLLPHLAEPTAPGHEAFAYSGGARTLRNDRYRLIVHKSGAVELFDHHSPALESRNIADSHPQLVDQLKRELEQRKPAQ